MKGAIILVSDPEANADDSSQPLEVYMAVVKESMANGARKVQVGIIKLCLSTHIPPFICLIPNRSVTSTMMRASKVMR